MYTMHILAIKSLKYRFETACDPEMETETYTTTEI